MKKIFMTIIIVFALLLLVGCDFKNGRTRKASVYNENKAVTLSNEEFEKFIIRFKNDSSFQKERIIFPLKNLLYNSDTGLFEEKMINKCEWLFFDFSKLPASFLSSITRTSDVNQTYNIQIKDTGVSVSYIFAIHNYKWYLVEIIDEST